MEKIKLLIGGSPCTYWSIAQTKDRETEPSGLGWELFLNYKIARDKYQPNYFLYENNKSMSTAIRAQITKELGVEPVLINSALVSAQNRQRLYWVGKRNPDGTYSQVPIEQPVDQGILLRDILESSVCWKEKAYCLAANRGGHCLEHDMSKSKYTYAAEPVRIGTIESNAKNADFDSQQYRVYSPDGKSVTLCGQGGGVGAKTGLYAMPLEIKNLLTEREMDYMVRASKGKYSDRWSYLQKPGEKDKAICLVANIHKGIPYNVVAAPVQDLLPADSERIVDAGGKAIPVYPVKDGLITIKDKQYPIKLADGFYIIRKLTVTECKRLQTVPDEYIFPVSDTQAYKMLGNGWTVDVIAHIMSHFEGIVTEPVEVLSMYDGMSCGHIALDRLGANVTCYYATEIDKYAIMTTQANYPGTVQLGDAFQVREKLKR